jgi:hypothetical protein
VFTDVDLLLLDLRLTLAAAFAAAFFMGDGFVAPSPAFLMFKAVLQKVPTPV